MMEGADERLEEIKARGYGLLIYFVEDGKVAELMSSSHEDDVYVLQRDAIRSVKELGTMEMLCKLREKR